VSQVAFLQDAERLLASEAAWAGLAGDALAFVLARVAADGQWLVVVDDADRADDLVRGLRFFHSTPGRVETFPADDARPYDGFSPSHAVVHARLRTLERVRRGRSVIVVAEARALRQRIPTEDVRSTGTRTVSVGDTLERDDLAAWLVDAGYLASGHADAPGRFAVRGDVLDVWPSSASVASRVDFWDDEIEALHRLRPDGRLGAKRKRLTVLPAREERIDAAAIDRLRTELTRLATGGADLVRRRRLMEDLSAGVRPSALEDYLPALVPTMAPLDALASARVVVVRPGDVGAALRDAEAQAQRRYELLDHDERPLVPPGERYLPAAAVLAKLEAGHVVHEVAAAGRAVDFRAHAVSSLAVKGADLAPVVARLRDLAGDDVRVGLVAESEDRASQLEQLLEPHGLRPTRVDGPDAMVRGKVSLLQGDLPRGFLAAESGWAFVPLSALFGARVRADRERAHALFESSVTSAAQLKDGDAVVHRLHGVGRYLGLVRLPVGEVHQDFAKLEYKGGDLLFLPVTALGQLSRFTPASREAKVRLDRLGGQSWAKRKGKVRDNLLKMADELLRLHARRELATREPHDPPGPRYKAFAARFPHVETPDQADAIEAVQADLSQAYPMDRLLCGDVGFGKTEVAMRAAMRVVENGRQVAVLCPTTVLAYQHLRSFEERFADDGDVQVGMLSRFNDRDDDQAVRAGLRGGSIDIVVGTTRLLGRGVRYADLGLLVIDEEHRFGVRQKEKLKKLRAQVDILSMSATPIPRTLQMALGGLRELSLIATPPSDRLAVRTTVAQPSEVRVRDAIRSEMERGGQCYVIHNRVETIDRFTQRLQRWVPDARFAVAHGQMDAQELEDILVAFIRGEHDVLVCTTIFESGIDLPNVNTMLIDRADRFGVAQLYQLRGRVGRSDRRATCVLLTPDEVSLEARRRLQVLVENSHLGAGFSVAAADLELRGGGSLLGSAQSGNIDKVGFETWVELLDEAVRSARGDAERASVEPEVEVPVDAFLPDNLITDPQERLGWYRALADARSVHAVESVVEELEGWVGELPEPARNLAGLAVTRHQCRELGITRCHWLKVRVLIELHEHSPLRGERIEEVVERHPKRFSISDRPDRPLQVSVRFTPAEADRPFLYLRWVMAQLSRASA